MASNIVAWRPISHTSSVQWGAGYQVWPNWLCSENGGTLKNWTFDQPVHNKSCSSIHFFLREFYQEYEKVLLSFLTQEIWFFFSSLGLKVPKFHFPKYKSSIFLKYEKIFFLKKYQKFFQSGFFIFFKVEIKGGPTSCILYYLYVNFIPSLKQLNESITLLLLDDSLFWTQPLFRQPFKNLFYFFLFLLDFF